MIQLVAFMWAVAFFFGIVGFLRGWNKELVATGGIVLAMFAIFQFDSLLRGTLYMPMSRSQIFLFQAAFFLGVIFFVYQARDLGGAPGRRDDDYQAGFRGALLGFFNGYLVGGHIWYLLDINAYPLEQYVLAPAVNSPSAQSINWIPLVIIGGGTSGTGDLLAFGVLVLLFVVLITV